ncbi:MAG: hypothetical protein HeimC3_14420 [Candidatus Heimdallarchaeota archaeon LC_3]|nr:MAG: hypothetical protein HeimC3_14420 [Candidatus Heimdallarchaeota archaeon LC_3]
MPTSYHGSKPTGQNLRTNEFFGIIFDFGQEFLTESSYRKEFNVIHVIGEDHYSLLKIFLKHQLMGKVIGDRIDLEANKSSFHRIRRISLKQIPRGSEYPLEEQLTKIVTDQENSKFIKFFNEAKPITIKLHQLKLLPGVGQKRMWTIIESRKQKKYDSYKDIEKRAGFSPIPVLVKRIFEELSGEEQHVLFVK